MIDERTTASINTRTSIPKPARRPGGVVGFPQIDLSAIEHADP